MSNLNLPIPDSLIDIQFQFSGALGDWKDEDAWCAAGAERFPDKFRIPRSEWDDWIRENEKHKSSADCFSARYTHQGPRSHECVSHAAIQAFEIARNRQFAGLSHAVYFSPLSLYTRITNGRQWGGSMVQDSLREMMSRGCIPEHDGPGGENEQYKKFRHTVHQTSGRTKSHWPTNGWIRPSDLPSGWELTAANFLVLEAYTIPDSEAFASALLRGWPLPNGRSGHSICQAAIVKRDKSYYSKYLDSYDRTLFDSERMWNNGGYCIRAVTMPDDPEKPVGDQMKEVA